MSVTIDLEGRTALVTGAGQGIGRRIGLTIAEAGARVLVNDVSPDRAGTVVEEIRSAGGASDALVFDVTEFDATMAAADGAGPVDILVNNAGNAGQAAFELTPFLESAPSEWDRYVAVNLFGVMHCCRAFVPGMVARGEGRVITIISDAARSGDARLAPYAAAKAGAAGFMRSLARDVSRHGVTVNNVALGTVDTFGLEAAAQASPETAERLERHLRPYLVKRLGRAEDVAGLVVFLASPLASWITGQTYPVNGGFTVNQ